MEKTHYANSHGLSNCENKSCVFDLALLCEYAMNNKQFRDIVSCKVYEANIKMENEDENGVA
jgi:D-alanyl-D-alanine carboxypeptidase